jgi:hypothetical protein
MRYRATTGPYRDQPPTPPHNGADQGATIAEGTHSLRTQQRASRQRSTPYEQPDRDTRPALALDRPQQGLPDAP